MEVVELGVVVHALRDLVEQRKIPGTQDELDSRTAKVETFVLAQVAFSILTQVSAPLTMRRCYHHAGRSAIPTPSMLTIAF